MAYNELTTSLYSKRGDMDGINVYRDRGEVYGKRERTQSGRISDNWFLPSTCNMTQVIKEKTIAGKRVSCMCVAENVDTWEKVESLGWKGLVDIVGGKADSMCQAYRDKRIYNGYLFYPGGQRPSEDEIDDMLDKWEALKKRLGRK